MTRALRNSRTFFDACVEGLFIRAGENQAVREVGLVQVALRLVGGNQPRIEETYSLRTPWGDWGVMGVVIHSTPVPRALFEDQEAVAASVATVRDRVASMETLSKIISVSFDVVSGRDIRFGEMSLPADFVRWVSIGVLAKILRDGQCTYGTVQGLLDGYHLALDRYFSRTRRGVWAGERGVPRSAAVAVSTSVCMSVMITMGLQR